jgi:uncharacterized protein (DUF1501 family)
MWGQEKFEKYVRSHPEHQHKSFFQRPDWTRRDLFRIAGAAGITGSFLSRRAYADGISRASVTPINRAKNVIYILLTGAPSNTDTFDLKVVPGATPTDFNPNMHGSILWPDGLMPKMGAQLGDIAIVRSMRAWALVHSLGQTWAQIGRNPAAALGDIAPNIGSIVALEKEKERQPGQVFPTFLSLNGTAVVGSGFLSTKYAPFKTTPSANGLPNVTNPDGQPRLNDKLSLMHSLDDPLRGAPSPYGKAFEDMDSFYSAASGLTYNPVVNNAFSYSNADYMRYGGSSFGGSLLVAKQVLSANQGTRFIHVEQGGWDMHQNIYDKLANPKGNLYVLASIIDNAVPVLIGDLKAAGIWDSTMIVMVGEFGRTVGALNPAAGRDHWPQQFVMFGGAGIKGGKTIGTTASDGGSTVDPGWSQGRDIKPEDVEATIYSAMGIDWTYVNYNDPFHRGFEYVPGGADGVYAPINELWS